MKLYKFIISVFLIITILFSSVLAIDSSNNLPAVVSQPSRSNFYGWISTLLNDGSLADQASLLWHDLIDDHLGCPNNNGGRHFFNFDTTVSLITGTVNDGAICSLCGMTYGDYCTGIHAAYDSYVDSIEDDLGTTTVTSSGNFLLPVPLSYVRDKDIHYDYCNYNHFIIPPTLLYGYRNYVYIDGDVIAPINGYYTPVFNLSHSSNISYSVHGVKQNKRYPFAEGSILADGFCLMSSYYPDDFIWAKGDIWFLVEPYVPLESLTQVDISPSTRIGSIPGNIGYLDTSTNTYIVTGGRLINEDNRTIYNPITDTTTTYEDYTYNYDNRSYTFNTGDSITYGDEHITYITNEGDTYNFYYYVQPSEPTPSPGPVPTPESHHWVQDSHTEPTCTEPGITTYHCSDCGESKTERIDALGHDWVEVDSQPDSYSLPPGTVCPDCGGSDLESVLVVDQYHCSCNDCHREFTVNANVEYGYKKYVCSRCGFEKTEDNSFSSGLWSALGDFLSHSVEWIGEKLKLLTDSLSGLTDSLHDATEDVIDSAGEYPAFLSEIVESFPAEFMSILWVCLIVVVIVLVFCKLLK